MATREENIKKINEELEKLSDEDLENVVGGSLAEAISDAAELRKRGLLNFENGCGSVEGCLHALGYTGYTLVDLDKIGGRSNIYTDKKGNRISREEFWKNFDAENGTKIIR